MRVQLRVWRWSVYACVVKSMEVECVCACS